MFCLMYFINRMANQNQTINFINIAVKGQMNIRVRQYSRGARNKKRLLDR